MPVVSAGTGAVEAGAVGPAPDAPESGATRLRVIDCDIHNVVPGVEALFPYLSAHWREHITNTLFKGPLDSAYPRNAPTTARPGSRPGEGRPAGSDLALLQRQLLDPVGPPSLSQAGQGALSLPRHLEGATSGPSVEIGVLCCAYAVDSIHNPDAAVALARAVNDWQMAEWLDREPRLRASAVVPSQLPQLAAQEIDRIGGHPGFVQVFLPVRSQHPYGSRVYHPMWEAMARHDLVAGIHFGGAPGNPPTPSGWPSYYFEEYAGMAQVFQSQLVSIVSEGVFDQFPTQRVALLEGGFTWLPAFLWRLDKEWRNLRRLVPWVKRPPSAYIREHVRLTIQPLDAPPDAAHLLQVIEQIGSDDLLLYASDYPHRHDADPEETLLRRLPAPLARKIRSENARAFYRLSPS